MIEIHLAVVLFGLAGLFGKFLSLPAWSIVLGRTGFAAMALMVVLIATRTRLSKNYRMMALFGLLGVLLAIHWVAFFQAIRVATVAVGLLAFSTFPVFITWMEPLWFDEKRRRIDLVTALMVLAGLGIMVYPSPLGGRVFTGVLWGTFAGFSFAVLSLLNRKWVQNHAAMVIAFYQNSFAALTLLPMVVWMDVTVNAAQIGWLALLGIFCTALAHTLFIRGLRTVRAQLASVIAALEPVYGVLFAYVLLHEVPSVYTLAGGMVILSATVLAMVKRV